MLQGADLPEDFAQKLVGIFKMLKIIKIVKIVILLLSLVGMGVAGYLHYRNRDSLTVTKTVQPVEKDPDTQKNNVISMLGGTPEEGQRNGLSGREFERY